MEIAVFNCFIIFGEIIIDVKVSDVELVNLKVGTSLNGNIM